MSLEDEKFTLLFHLLKPKVGFNYIKVSDQRAVNTFLFFNNCGFMSLQNSDAENLVLIEMLDTNEDGEVDSFEWTTMLSKVGICK